MSLADDFDSVPVNNNQPATQTKSLADDFDSTPVGKSKTTISPLGSDTQNFMAGAGKGVTDIGRAAMQIMDVPAQWLEKKFPGISQWSQAKGLPSAAQSAQQTNADVAQSRELDQPLMDTKAGIGGDIAGNLATSMIPLGAASAAGSGIAKAMLNPTTYKAAAAVGAAMGALQPVTDDESRLRNTGIGAATGLGSNAVVNTIGRIAQPVAQIMSDAHAKAVQVLQNSGVPLDAAQQTGSVFLNKLRSSFWDNPLTAGAQNDLTQVQKQTYQSAVLKTMGANGTAATSDVMGQNADRIGGVFSDVLNRNNVTLSDPIIQRIGVVQAAANDEEKTSVSNVANRIINSVDNNGTIPGQVAYGIKKDLDRMSSSADTSLAFHARQLNSTLKDAINESLSPEDQQAFSQARSEFSNMKKIENAVANDGSGDISPAKLASTMAQKANRQSSVYGRGDQQLVDLAQSGNMLLRDKQPNSGTVPRLVMQMLAPAALGGVIGGLQEGDISGVAKGVALGAVLPKAAQAAMNNPSVARYLASGMQGGMTPLRTLLQSPQTNNVIGGALRRIPQAFTQTP